MKELKEVRNGLYMQEFYAPVYITPEGHYWIEFE